MVRQEFHKLLIRVRFTYLLPISSEQKAQNAILRYQLSSWMPLNVDRREMREDGEWVQLPFA